MTNIVIELYIRHLFHNNNTNHLTTTPTGLNDSAVAAYYGLMVESASMLGADRREAEIQMLDVLNFETQLANVSSLAN